MNIHTGIKRIYLSQFIEKTKRNMVQWIYQAFYESLITNYKWGQAIILRTKIFWIHRSTKNYLKWYARV